MSQNEKHRNEYHGETPKSLENAIRDGNNLFENVGQLVTNRTTQNIKNDVNKSHKSSTIGSTKRQHKMISRKSQK